MACRLLHRAYQSPFHHGLNTAPLAGKKLLQQRTTRPPESNLLISYTVCTVRNEIKNTWAVKPMKAVDQTPEPSCFLCTEFSQSLHVIRAAALGNSTHSPGKAHGKQALHIMWLAWGSVSSDWTHLSKGRSPAWSLFRLFSVIIYKCKLQFVGDWR